MTNERFEYDELVYRGRVAEVHRIGLRMPDGKVVPRDFFHYNGAVVILPVRDDGSVVFIRNYRFAVDERLLELPAGMIDGDEDPAVAARRELAEETGFTAERIEPLGMFYTGPGTTNERMFAFLATGLTDGEQDLEVYEEITLETLPADRIRPMIRSGELHDGKSISALALYWLREGTM